MKNGNMEVKETVNHSIEQQLKIKIKELANAPKDIPINNKQERITKREKADQIAVQRLEKQKTAQVSEFKGGELEKTDNGKQDFKHKLDPKLNKGSDISFGASGCLGYCGKMHDPSKVHGTYHV